MKKIIALILLALHLTSISAAPMSLNGRNLKSEDQKLLPKDATYVFKDVSGVILGTYNMKLGEGDPEPPIWRVIGAIIACCVQYTHTTTTTTTSNGKTTTTSTTTFGWDCDCLALACPPPCTYENLLQLLLSNGYGPKLLLTAEKFGINFPMVEELTNNLREIGISNYNAIHTVEVSYVE